MKRNRYHDFSSNVGDPRSAGAAWDGGHGGDLAGGQGRACRLLGCAGWTIAGLARRIWLHRDSRGPNQPGSTRQNPCAGTLPARRWLPSRLIDQRDSLFGCVLSQEDQLVQVDLFPGKSHYIRAELRAADEGLRAMTAPIYF